MLTHIGGEFLCHLTLFLSDDRVIF